MAEVKKADLKSMDIPENKLRQLKQTFPEAFTEGLKVDLDKLRLLLGENVDAGRERFGMNWPGKADCFKIIQAPSVATLIPARSESVNFDTTENLFIEGDNLEVLKLLQRSYNGTTCNKIKIIYIDPPYNTGKEFIYPDNYAESLDTYLRYSGQIDDDGRKYSTNAETDGRFHSKWLNMMYPRLYLAKNLLRDDGVIFISIDDNELHHLRKICDEILGEENFIGVFIKQSKVGGGSDSKHIVKEHEYCLTYAKNADKLEEMFTSHEEEYLKRYKEEDDHGKYFWDTFARPGLQLKAEESLNYEIACPDGSTIKTRWIRSKERFEKEYAEGIIRIIKKSDGSWSVQFKQYLNLDGKKPRSMTMDFGGTIEGKNEITELFSNDKIFSYPKSTIYLKSLIKIIEGKDCVILDFFAGSGTTAHAVLAQNQEDGGDRKFICVQLPEPCAEDSEAFKKGYKNIADIGKERIRRVIKKIKEEQKQFGKKEKSLFDENKNAEAHDLGFKVFKLAQSNFKVWNGDAEPKKEAVEKQLEMHVDHINPKSSQEDILFELLLKAGFELTTKIEKISITGKTVYSIEGGLMLICLEKELTKEVIKAMAEKTPSRVICLDQGFSSNDQLKTNAVQIMKSKGVEDFRTV